MIFSKTNFGPTRVYVLSSISRTLYNFSTGFFSMYRGMLELKNNTNILFKNGPFANKTCCALTVLFAKMKIYFCCCNFGNKINEINRSLNFFFVRKTNGVIIVPSLYIWPSLPRGHYQSTRFLY